jgi:hypothetical protein
VEKPIYNLTLVYPFTGEPLVHKIQDRTRKVVESDVWFRVHEMVLYATHIKYSGVSRSIENHTKDIIN